MSMVARYHDNGELSLAAYGDFYDGMSRAAYEAALRQNGDGMAQKQAETFAANWRVIDQHDDTTNGLSATVFQSVTTGERYLAVRGTEQTDLSDLWTDFIDIAVLGTPERQAQFASLRDKVIQWLSDGTLT